MNAVFFIVHISGRKSVYHSCIMMYENIIVNDSTIIYNNYACQPLIIFIFFVAYDIAQVVHCLICVTVHEQTLHLMNRRMSVPLYVYFSLYQPSTSSICALLVFHIKKNQDASLLENNKKYLHSILFSHTFCHVLLSCKKDNPVRGIFLLEGYSCKKDIPVRGVI